MTDTTRRHTRVSRLPDSRAAFMELTWIVGQGLELEVVMQISRRPILVFLVLCALISLGTRPALADPGRRLVFAFKTIEVPGSIFTIALANNSHEIAGEFLTPEAGATEGFVLSDGVITPFAVPGALLTAFFGINARGDLAGVFLTPQVGTPPFVEHGFFLRDGQVTVLDPPGSVDSFATHLNSQDEVVGKYTDANGNVHGFVWRDGRFTTLDVPGTTDTELGGINNHGDIVGFYTDQQGIGHGFVLNGGHFSSFDVPGAAFTAPLSINNRGDIAGVSIDPGGNRHGFVLSDGVFTTVDVDLPNAMSTQIENINDAGQIVGTFMVAGDPLPLPHGFIGNRVR